MENKGLILINTGNGKGKRQPLWELLSVHGEMDRKF